MAKYFIAGGSGSGKTTYARQLSEQLNIPRFDLDDIYWITYGHNRSKRERDILLSQILRSNPNWIIEGVYTSSWISPVIEQCDKIIIINPPTWKRQWRILHRTLTRIISGHKNTHNETIKSVCKLLAWSARYESDYLPELISRIKSTNKSYTVINGKEKIK